MAAPVKNTCPDIDRVIKKIKSALRSAEHGLKLTEKGDGIYDCFDDIQDELMFLEGELEDLRGANDSLRTWGIKLESELEDAAATINELETKLEYQTT